MEHWGLTPMTNDQAHLLKGLGDTPTTDTTWVEASLRIDLLEGLAPAAIGVHANEWLRKQGATTREASLVVRTYREGLVAEPRAQTATRTSKGELKSDDSLYAAESAKKRATSASAGKELAVATSARRFSTHRQVDDDRSQLEQREPSDYVAEDEIGV
jgi:hypothetical protein